ncbi:unnamed protein product [Acanthoscelides obtectus]|nr:unnamed protein product [Acanthoscelides obtectus]CAK1635559.1 hypothetical protein AOBTE_LOCUS9354 [Acanthoscelides obtectus]
MECATNIVTGATPRSANWDVLQTELRKHAHVYPADIDTEYACAKYSFSYSLNGEVATTRTCLPKKYGNLEACDYLKTVIPINYNLESCFTCDTDYCNSSSGLSTSLVFVLSALLLFKYA